jgi:hypothetical protein
MRMLSPQVSQTRTSTLRVSSTIQPYPQDSRAGMRDQAASKCMCGLRTLSEMIDVATATMPALGLESGAERRDRRATVEAAWWRRNSAYRATIGPLSVLT